MVVDINDNQMLKPVEESSINSFTKSHGIVTRSRRNKFSKVSEGLSDVLNAEPDEMFVDISEHKMCELSKDLISKHGTRNLEMRLRRQIDAQKIRIEKEKKETLRWKSKYYRKVNEHTQVSENYKNKISRLN